MLGFYTVHNAGKVNGQGPDLYIFNIYKPDRTYGSCHVVEEQAAARNREALLDIGYKPY